MAFDISAALSSIGDLQVTTNGINLMDRAIKAAIPDPEAVSARRKQMFDSLMDQFKQDHQMVLPEDYERLAATAAKLSG